MVHLVVHIIGTYNEILCRHQTDFASTERHNIHMYILNAHVCLWIYSTKIKAGVNLLYKGGHCSIICNDKDKNILIKMSINERLVK